MASAFSGAPPAGRGEVVQALDVLRETGSQYQCLVEDSLCGVYILQGDKIVYANPKFAEIFGYTQEEILELDVLDLVATEDRPLTRENIRRRIAGEATGLTYSIRGRRRDGSLIQLEIYGSRTQYNGAPAAIGTVIDRTERHRAEQGLRESEERFRALAEATSAAIFIYQGASFLYVNPAAERLTGFSRDELLAMDVWDVAHPEFRARAKEIVLARQRGEAVPSRYELRLLTKDAEERWLDLSAASITFQGQPAVVGAAFDVTERHRAEEILKSRERLLGALLTRLHSVREEERARISREIHDELGQTLTVVRMEVSRLRKGAAASDLGPIDDMLALLDRTMDSVRKLATELRPVVLETFGLKAAVKWETKEFSRRSGIECSLEAASVDRSLDPERSTAVFRILQEALTNAARHAGASRVRVRLRVEKGEASLVVEDDGVGISPEKASDSTSLGLLGMRERALSLGGVVTIGPRPERGTSVELRIPRAEAEP